VAVCRRVLFESSTGFVTFGTRSYNPAWERLTQQNTVAGSLGNPASLNRYLYAKDDSVNVVDPSGASLSPAGTVAVILGLIAAGCTVLTIDAIISILGIPASPIFAICAGVFGLGAAYEAAVTFFFGG